MDWKSLASKAFEKAETVNHAIIDYLDKERVKLMTGAQRYEKYSAEELEKMIRSGKLSNDERRYAEYAYRQKI